MLQRYPPCLFCHEKQKRQTVLSLATVIAPGFSTNPVALNHNMSWKEDDPCPACKCSLVPPGTTLEPVKYAACKHTICAECHSALEMGGVETCPVCVDSLQRPVRATRRRGTRRAPPHKPVPTPSILLPRTAPPHKPVPTPSTLLPWTAPPQTPPTPPPMPAPPRGPPRASTTTTAGGLGAATSPETCGKAKTTTPRLGRKPDHGEGGAGTGSETGDGEDSEFEEGSVGGEGGSTRTTTPSRTAARGGHKKGTTRRSDRLPSHITGHKEAILEVARQVEAHAQRVDEAFGSFEVHAAEQLDALQRHLVGNVKKIMASARTQAAALCAARGKLVEATRDELVVTSGQIRAQTARGNLKHAQDLALQGLVRVKDTTPFVFSSMSLGAVPVITGVVVPEIAELDLTPDRGIVVTHMPNSLVGDERATFMVHVINDRGSVLTGLQPGDVEVTSRPRALCNVSGIVAGFQDGQIMVTFDVAGAPPDTSVPITISIAGGTVKRLFAVQALPSPRLMEALQVGVLPIQLPTMGTCGFFLFDVQANILVHDRDGTGNHFTVVDLSNVRKPVVVPTATGAPVSMPRVSIRWTSAAGGLPRFTTYDNKPVPPRPLCLVSGGTELIVGNAFPEVDGIQPRIVPVSSRRDGRAADAVPTTRPVYFYAGGTCVAVATLDGTVISPPSTDSSSTEEPRPAPPAYSVRVLANWSPTRGDRGTARGHPVLWSCPIRPAALNRIKAASGASRLAPPEEAAIPHQVLVLPVSGEGLWLCNPNTGGILFNKLGKFAHQPTSVAVARGGLALVVCFSNGSVCLVHHDLVTILQTFDIPRTLYVFNTSDGGCLGVTERTQQIIGFEPPRPPKTPAPAAATSG